MAVESREIEFPVPWGRIAGLEWGDDKALQHWLLVHGWLDNLMSWSYLAPLLAKRGDHVVCIDLPGHGLSDWLPAGVMYHDLDFISAVHRVCTQLKWDSFGLIGHSLGGGICLTYAATFPEKVNCLVMLDITFLPIRPFTPHDFQERLRMSVDSLLRMEKKLSIRGERVMATWEEARERLLKPPAYFKEFGGATQSLNKDSAEIVLQRGIKRMDGGFVFRRDPRLVIPSSYLIDFGDQKKQAAKITCPHLIVMSTEGPKSEFGLDMFNIYRENPHFKQISMEGSHHVHLNNPKEINQIILEFIDDHEDKWKVDTVKIPSKL